MNKFKHVLHVLQVEKVLPVSQVQQDLQVLQVRASIVIRSDQQNKIQQVTSAADVIVDIGASGNLIMKVKIENKINSLNKKRIWP